MQKIVLAVATAAAVLSGVGTATAADRIDQREYNQERRIQEGRRAGDISGREYRALEAEQAHIRQLEARARADGRIDRNERAQIERAQDAASRHIAEARNNNDRRRWYSWR